MGGYGENDCTRQTSPPESARRYGRWVATREKARTMDDEDEITMKIERSFSRLTWMIAANFALSALILWCLFTHNN